MNLNMLLAEAVTLLLIVLVALAPQLWQQWKQRRD